jgi:transcriptional regulator GlxA family with amidase domain
MLSIGFVVTPGFPVMSLAALSVFEFANFSADKSLYDIHVLSEDGGAIPSASGTSLETTAFGDRASTRLSSAATPAPCRPRPSCSRSFLQRRRRRVGCFPFARACSRSRTQPCSAIAA